MTFTYITYEKRDHVAWVTINRPEAMNALNRAANVELRTAFHDFRDDPGCWVAVLTGAGERAFCAGNDLKASARRNAGTTEAGDDVTPEHRAPFGGITENFDCFKPIIAAVNGFALGGGMELALVADIVVAADQARFGLPEAKVGLLAMAGGLVRLPRQIPVKVASAMILAGEQLGAAEALHYGLVNEVVPGAELVAAAQRWADKIIGCSPTSVRLSKEVILRSFDLSIEEGLALSRKKVEELKASADFVEGPRAFAEKRRPQWTGR